MFRIFTDSSANLPEQWIEQHGVGVVSLTYQIGETRYSAFEEGATFDGHAYYETMRQGTTVSTSLVNSEAFRQAFQTAAEAGDDVLFVGMSSGISGTFHQAELGAEEAAEACPGRAVLAFDTKAASLGEGLQVMEAVRLRDEGRTIEETVLALGLLREHICQYFTVDELKYLLHGGRLSALLTFFSEKLKLKALLQGNDSGKIVLSGKVRGRNPSLDALAAKFRELTDGSDSPVGVAHGDCPVDAAYLIAKLREAGFQGEVLNVCYEPVTGSHVGPGTVALFFRGIHR